MHIHVLSHGDSAVYPITFLYNYHSLLIQYVKELHEGVALSLLDSLYSRLKWLAFRP